MKPTKLLIFILLSGLFQGLMAQNNFHNVNYQDPYNPAYDTGVVLVKFKDNVDMQVYKSGKGIAQTGYASVDKFLEQYEAKEMDKVFRNVQKRTTKKTFSFGGEVHEVPQLFNIYKIELDTKTSTDQMVEELQADPLVEYAEPDYLVYTQENKSSLEYNPNDPLYQDGSQWYLDAINAPAAWEITTGDTSQVIAIIDTGVDWDHPDLDDNIWTSWDEIPDNGIDDDGNGYVDDVRGWDFINEDNDPNDDNSHGTHVAGIAAAEGNNEIGITGVAFNSRIMPVKMLQSTGIGNSSDFAAAIQYASENGATVINMSLGSYGESLTVKTALENAYAGTGDGEGSMLVAAAGNDGYKVDPPFPPEPLYAPMYPACYNFILGVEASVQSPGVCGMRACWSNFDPSGPIIPNNPYNHNYEVRAPGTNIISAKPNGGYWGKNGTSMASPEVAGAVALMRNHQPEQSGEQIFAKLIQGANGGVMDVENSLIIELEPDLYYIDYTIVDTLPGCDGDGRADAGETIELFLTVKNAGGQADSVWSKLHFGQFEDTTTATIIDSTTYIGGMSAYSTMNSELNPFKIKINSDVVNNRKILLEHEIGYENGIQNNGTLIIDCQKGREFSGYVTGTTVLSSNELNIITDNTVFDSLIIKPGAKLAINPNKSVFINKDLIAIGKPDSLIHITSNGIGYWKVIKRVDGDYHTYKYCNIEYGGIEEGSAIKGTDTVQNCIFSHNYSVLNYENCYFNKNVVHHNSEPIGNYQFLLFGNTGLTKDNIISNNVTLNNYFFKGALSPQIGSQNLAKNNVLINNKQKKFNNLYHFEAGIANDNQWGTYTLNQNYYGVNDSSYIEEHTLDFFEFSNHPIIMGYTNRLTSPSEGCHGVVWKIEINDILINKYDNYYNAPSGIGIIGSETLKFDVYFNRAMDTSVTPLVTFGVREPYTQHVVSDSASWSEDSTTWTAYQTTDMGTGDGIQRVRVANARDDENFEIPIENSRFEFVVQVAGAQSINFLATPGIGKVDLEWPPATTDDALGYNLYRFHNMTDSTYSDTTLINTELVLDTLYTDFNVIPDTSYHYLYKTVGTDMAETDYSKSVQATPFTAANGDANGSMGVNVLDITTIVNYMLGNAPEPFLFDAADVNYDGSINVLDIIGVVQIIQGNKSVPLSKIITTNTNPAYISMEGKTIQLESEGNVAALSFELQGEELDKLKLLSKTKGFEFALSQSDSLIKGILYSLSGNTIPEGKVTLFEATEPITATTFGALTGGDWEGNYVPVLKEGEELPKPESYQLQAYPNPFTGQTTIQYDLPEQSDVTITIYDMSGKVVWQQQKNNLQAGNYEYLWNSSETKGMYLLTIQAKGETQNWEKQVKLVQLK